MMADAGCCEIAWRLGRCRAMGWQARGHTLGRDPLAGESWVRAWVHSGADEGDDARVLGRRPPPALADYNVVLRARSEGRGGWETGTDERSLLRDSREGKAGGAGGGKGL